MVDDRTKWNPAELSPKQIRVLEVMLEGALQDNIASVANKARVRRASIYEWLNESHRGFSAAFRKAWDGLFDIILKDAIPVATAALKRKAAKGDVQAIKLILELQKKYQPSWLKVEGEGASIESLVLASMNQQQASASQTPAAEPEAKQTADQTPQASPSRPSPPAPEPEPVPAGSRRRRSTRGKGRRPRL